MNITSKQVKMTLKEFEQITELMPKLHSISQQLFPTINDTLKHEFAEMKSVLSKFTEDYWKWSEKKEDLCENQIEKIRLKHKFSSLWSVEDMEPKNFNKDFSNGENKKIKSITYKSWGQPQTIKFKNAKNFTWLELWKIADDLITASQDTHHIYIEGFSEDDSKKPGHYFLLTGS